MRLETVPCESLRQKQASQQKVCNNPILITGDVLLSINGIDLTHLNYYEAVSALKSNAASHSVVLKALEILSPNSTEPSPDIKEQGFGWSPLWITWLGLPRYAWSVSVTDQISVSHRADCPSNNSPGWLMGRVTGILP